MTDDSSDNQSAILAKNTGFFDKLRKILISFSAIEWPLSVSLE